MTATEAKNLLLPIPNEDFLTDERFSDGNSKCCVIGHLQRLSSRKPNDYSLSNCNDKLYNRRHSIRISSKKYLKSVLPPDDTRRYGYLSIADINNGPEINGYTEPEPKDRVLHLLDDMLAAGY